MSLPRLTFTVVPAVFFYEVQMGDIAHLLLVLPMNGWQLCATKAHWCGICDAEEKGEHSKGGCRGSTWGYRGSTGGCRGSNSDKGANLHVECGMQFSLPTDLVVGVCAMWLCHASKLCLPFD